MNRKQFIILLVLVALIGTAGWIVRKHNQGSWQSSGQATGKLLPNFPLNDVAQVIIQSRTNNLHLVRRDNVWRVQERADYPANFSQISDLLIKLSDLKISQSQDVGPSQLGRFELLPPGAGAGTGTLLQFND
jgi:Flp pilus assembly protein CpaB